MIIPMRFLVPALLVTCISASAAVVDSSASGFTVKATRTIHASPATVFAKLLQVGDWWDPVHTYSHDAHNLSIDAKAGGCYCEKLSGGGGVKHMEVVFLQPGKRLVMTGGLGPMQAMGVAASLAIDLAPSADGTLLTYSYAVGGYSPTGLNTLAPIIDTVLGQQFTRLVNDIERGSPTAAAQK